MSSEHRWNAVEEGEEITYKAFCIRAGIAFALGLLSPTIFIHKGLAVIAVGAILVASSALLVIMKNPDRLTGRLFAQISLFIAILSLAAVPIDDYLYWRSIESGAIEAADEFIAYLQADEPHMAMEMKRPVWSRADVESSDELLLSYLDGPKPFESLVDFTSDPLLRSIIELGDRADIRLYRISKRSSSSETDFIELIYAVTYDKSVLIDIPGLEEDEEAPVGDDDESNVFPLFSEDEFLEVEEDIPSDAPPVLESMGLQTFFVGIVVELQQNQQLNKKSWCVIRHEMMTHEGVYLSTKNNQAAQVKREALNNNE